MRQTRQLPRLNFSKNEKQKLKGKTQRERERERERGQGKDFKPTSTRVLIIDHDRGSRDFFQSLVPLARWIRPCFLYFASAPISWVSKFRTFLRVYYNIFYFLNKHYIIDHHTCTAAKCSWNNYIGFSWTLKMLIFQLLSSVIWSDERIRTNFN